MTFEMQMSENKAGRFYTLSSDKVTLIVSVCRNHVTTCVDNAANRAWRGPGKTFHGADALAKAAGAYKSAVCKAMIEAVQAAERALANAADATVRA